MIIKHQHTNLNHHHDHHHKTRTRSLYAAMTKNRSRIPRKLLLAQLAATCCLVIILGFNSVQCQALASAPPIQLSFDKAEIAVEGQKLKMTMNETRQVVVILKFDQKLIQLQKFDLITVQFVAKTVSPQFKILDILDGTDRLSVSKRELTANGYTWRATVSLRANYIGHATISLADTELSGTNKIGTISTIRNSNYLEITVLQYEGIWDIIFIVSVTLLIIMTYINLGAQLDQENINKMLKKPQALILGFLISVLVMPILSYAFGVWLLGDQINYRIGSFVFACGPAASASTLWTVMLDCDKELSVGLQVASTVGALVSMPILLYLMEVSMGLQERDIYMTRIPYGSLISSFLVLSIALVIGWKFIGQHERAQKISRKIFRPLTFFVLIYIIVFSSIVYWHIYQMFDWDITLTSFLISVATYIISALLGYLVNGFNGRSIEQAVAISIGSTYKNSGIAFAVLMVIFEKPDHFIAYVPCLTQVVTTSAMLYSIYSGLKIVNCIRRRNQPNPITAESGASAATSAGKPTGEAAAAVAEAKTSRSGSASSQKSAKSDQQPNSEFIPMNVTDVDTPPTSPRGDDATVTWDQTTAQQVDEVESKDQNDTVQVVVKQ